MPHCQLTVEIEFEADVGLGLMFPSEEKKLSLYPDVSADV